ncbi:Histone-lysine N-methyltransferase SETMAR [Araneus ventricosus]|uniref:Histone-lysine N-methyltransferase SETMAR n=1 Tax=Araneus ventricosus TaxID=182803 RepID=A0A4Y2IHI6_ARAVE|nr:Histone-lysine N-methyltransferase SETMAR [Araneus ventricosus]
MKTCPSSSSTEREKMQQFLSMLEKERSKCCKCKVVPGFGVVSRIPKLYSSATISLSDDNARPHAAAVTKELLDQFGWEFFNHPPYTPDLSPSDFHFFLKLKEFLGGKRFGSDEELENAVTSWFNELAAEEYNMGILRLVNRYDKCLNLGGGYVEK